MKTDAVLRDERTISIENASYRWAYIVLSFGLLAIVAYRSRASHESNWDLMALVIAGGLMVTVYQAFHQILNRRWAWIGLATFLVGSVVAIAIVLKR